MTDTSQPGINPTKGTPREILIVDDDNLLLDMYAMRFSQAGFNVTTSMNAQETLDKLRGGLKPEIMLMDVVMPAVDGFEMLEQINTEQLAPGAVKIFLSNLGQEEDISRGKSLGAASYIVKVNNTPSEVVAHVLDVVEHHGS